MDKWLTYAEIEKRKPTGKQGQKWCEPDIALDNNNIF